MTDIPAPVSVTGIISQEKSHSIYLYISAAIHFYYSGKTESSERICFKTQLILA
jgi:hypothetical protein